MIEKPDAEEFSQSLEQIGEGWFRQLALGIKLKVPEALGLSRREWSDRIGVTVRGAAERRGAVTELAAEGLSNRAIADVLGVDDRTVRRDLTGPTAANAAPTENQQGSGWDDAAAFAAGDHTCMLESDAPKAAKDAVVLLASTIRFFTPYRFGGQKVGEYAKRKLTEDLAGLVCLMWDERAFWRGKSPAEWDELERLWRSDGLPLDDIGTAP
jgi:hypothetical protein